ncbi:54S ribosomal protein L12, mitochondrial, partial [Neurospora sp. IMI 360204]
MSLSVRFAAQCAARQLRASTRASSSLLVQKRFESTAAPAANPKIAAIVDQISTLTLLETSELVSSLK